MRPDTNEPPSRQNEHRGSQHFYNYADLGRPNHGYDAGSSDVKEPPYDDVILSSDSSVSAIGANESGVYLGMNKSSGTVPGTFSDSSSFAVKYSRTPRKDELKMSSHPASDYSYIDDGAAVISTLPSADFKDEMVKANGKQQLINQRYGNFSTARRRSNPLYVDLDSAVGHKSKDVSAFSCCCCWCGILQIISFLVSVAAIVLAIIALIQLLNERQDMAAKYDEILKRYEEMKELMRSAEQCNCSNTWSSPSVTNNDRFNQQTPSDNQSQFLLAIDSLQNTVQNLQDVLLRNITVRINSLVVQTDLLKAGNANITNALNFFRQDLTYQINQIPKGLTNLSTCRHYADSSGSPALSSYNTAYLPNLNNSVVLGVVCSTTGGTQAFLDYDSRYPNVYSCVCRGQVNSTVTSRYCFIHYWTCPMLP